MASPNAVSRAGHPHLRLVEQGPERLQVLGERRLYERRRPEEDQPDAIALPVCQEVVQHLLHGGETVDLLARRIGKVLRLHRSGEIDGEQQVARRYRSRDWLLEPLRARQRGDHAQPDRPHRDLLDERRAQLDGAGRGLLSGQRRHAVEEGNRHAHSRLPVRRQRPAQQEREHRERQQPGIGEGQHDQAASATS